MGAYPAVRKVFKPIIPPSARPHPETEDAFIQACRVERNRPVPWVIDELKDMGALPGEYVEQANALMRKLERLEPKSSASMMSEKIGGQPMFDQAHVIMMTRAGYRQDVESIFDHVWMRLDQPQFDVFRYAFCRDDYVAHKPSLGMVRAVLGRTYHDVREALDRGLCRLSLKTALTTC